jgi:hypothetical protein
MVATMQLRPRELLAQSALVRQSTHVFVEVSHAGMPETWSQSEFDTHCTHSSVAVLHADKGPMPLPKPAQSMLDVQVPSLTHMLAMHRSMTSPQSVVWTHWTHWFVPVSQTCPLELLEQSLFCTQTMQVFVDVLHAGVSGKYSWQSKLVLHCTQLSSDVSQTGWVELVSEQSESTVQVPPSRQAFDRQFSPLGQSLLCTHCTHTPADVLHAGVDGRLAHDELLVQSPTGAHWFELQIWLSH